jgi:beta-N-acetylhexosaminidase
LAPVADINNNPDNLVINVRSFGETVEKVESLIVPWIKGCHEARFAVTLKHFPGHCDTNIDSNSDLPTINHPLERLYNVELRPFIEGIRAGSDTIMTAHIYFPALEERHLWPATLSKSVLTGLLKKIRV